MKSIKSNMRYLVLIAFSITLFGCEDFYFPPKNEFPGDEAVESTLNLELIINGAYAPMGKYFSANHMIISEIFAGPSIIYTNEGISNQSYVDIRNFNLSETIGLTNSVWSDCYKAINRANIVISAIENSIEPLDDFFNSQKNRLLGEAYFIRALGNFTLIKQYGQQYSVSNLGMPGIILRTEPTTGRDYGSRSTVNDAYELILSDLQNASMLLPVEYSAKEFGNFPGYRNRAKKAAAVALLAKVYFQMNDFDHALEQVKRVIGDVAGEIADIDSITGNNTPKLAGDITDNFTTEGVNQAVSEAIFYIVNEEPESDFTIEVRNAIFNNPDALWQGIFMYPEEFLSLFSFEDYYSEDDDARFQEFIQTAEYQDSIIPHSAKYGYNETQYLNIPVIRSAELVLMRAEINAIKGYLSKALADLNFIIARAGHTPLSPPIQQSKMIQLIVIERIKELDMEGDRYDNWKRMGAYNAEISNVYPARAYAPFERDGKTFEWNSQETLAKIPQDEMNSNPEMDQSQQN